MVGFRYPEDNGDYGVNLDSCERPTRVVVIR